MVALVGVALGALLFGEALARATNMPPWLFWLGASAVVALALSAMGLGAVWWMRRKLLARKRAACGVAWRRLRPAGFEREVARLFARAGYQVRLVGASGDGGVDVRVWALGRVGIEHGIVQCKCYAATHAVGPATIRELIGARAHEHAGSAWLATTGRLTRGALRLATEEQIRVLDATTLAAWDARLP